MESVIKWQTSEPKERGAYLVVLKDGSIIVDIWQFWDDNCNAWHYHKNSNIIAWYKLSDIKLYKDEKPIVKHWMNKCAMLTQELDILNEKYNSLKEELESFKASTKYEAEKSSYWYQQYCKLKEYYEKIIKQ